MQSEGSVSAMDKPRGGRKESTKHILKQNKYPSSVAPEKELGGGQGVGQGFVKHFGLFDLKLMYIFT